MENVQKKVAVVTGAGAGIGQSIALALASNGYTVYANARSEAKIAETLEKGKQCGYDMRPLIFDVSVETEVSEKLASLTRIDCLVNNAGIGIRKKLEETTGEDWDNVLNTNVKGYFFCIQNALLKMGRGANIINLSSGAAKTGGIFVSLPYSASKGAINSMTIFYAKRLAEKGIRVNAVSPGFVDTSMLIKNEKQTNEYYASIIPLGILGEPEDIAQCVCYLASEQARYITGQIIEVNGGDIVG